MLQFEELKLALNNMSMPLHEDAKIAELMGSRK